MSRVDLEKFGNVLAVLYKKLSFDERPFSALVTDARDEIALNVMKKIIIN